jgi:hypothetical protein
MCLRRRLRELRVLPGPGRIVHRSGVVLRAQRGQHSVPRAPAGLRVRRAHVRHDLRCLRGRRDGTENGHGWAVWLVHRARDPMRPPHGLSGRADVLRANGLVRERDLPRVLLGGTARDGARLPLRRGLWRPRGPTGVAHVLLLRRRVRRLRWLCTPGSRRVRRRVRAGLRLRRSHLRERMLGGGRAGPHRTRGRVRVSDAVALRRADTTMRDRRAAIIPPRAPRRVPQ